jgi:hypothetical protein
VVEQFKPFVDGATRLDALRRSAILRDLRVETRGKSRRSGGPSFTTICGDSANAIVRARKT